MDWITQAALGAIIGQAMLGKQLGNRAIGWGVLGILGFHLLTLPALLLPFAAAAYVAPGISHSLFLALLVSFYGGRGLSKFSQRGQPGRKNKKPLITAGQASSFLFALWLAQVLYAAFTIEGAWVLWPIPFGRITFPALLDLDLLIILPIGYCLFRLSRLQEKKELPQRAVWLRRGLGSIIIVLVVSLGLKAWVHEGVKRDLTHRGMEAIAVLEAPVGWDRLLWRTMVRTPDDTIWVGYRSILQLPGTPIHWTGYPMRSEVLPAYSGNRAVKASLWLTQGWYLVRPNKKGVWVASLLTPEARLWGVKKGNVDHFPNRSWVIEISKTGNRSYLKSVPENTLDTFQRQGWLILDRREKWDAFPRLAGIPGSFPESLAEKP